MHRAIDHTVVREGLGKLKLINPRRHIPFHQLWNLVGAGVAQNKEIAAVNPFLAQGDGLVQKSDSQPGHALVLQELGHIHAVAIGVRLDHAHDPGLWPYRFFYLLKVKEQVLKLDLRPGRPVGRDYTKIIKKIQGKHLLSLVIFNHFQHHLGCVDHRHLEIILVGFYQITVRIV